MISPRSVSAGVAFVAAITCLIGTGFVGLDAGRAASTAGSTSLAVSLTGNDAGPCTPRQPCASLGRAYAVAPAGAVIEVGAGDYPAQRIVRNPASATSSSVTTIRPVPGASVRLQSLTLGDAEGGNGPSHLLIESLAVPAEPLEIREGSLDIELRNVSGANFHLVGASDIRIIGGSWGPCLTDGVTAKCANSKIDYSLLPPYTTNNVLIQGASFHDYRIVPDSGAHFECLFLRGGTNIKVIQSTFSGCEFFDIFVQGTGFEAPFDGLRIEQNLFKSPYDGHGNPNGRAVMLSGRGYVWNNVAIRRNSFMQSMAFLDDGTSAGWVNVEFSGNIGDAVDACKPDVRYLDNILTRARCGVTDTSGAPYGYILGDGRLTLDNQRARAVQNVFRLRAAGRQVWNIATELRKSGAPRPPSGWTSRGVTALLSDPRYLGGTLGAPGAHPAVVTRRAWNAARAMDRKQQAPAR